MTEQKLAELLHDMSLKEKINQMLQVSGMFFDEKDVITGPMRAQGFSEENIALAGSVLGMLGAEKLKEQQKKYMETQPHKIPMLFMLDVINGFKTIFPIPLGQGATFEPELLEKCAQVAAKEAAVSGVHVTFAPMVDLVRDARWGRVMESPGEDPYMNQLFSAAMVRGYQGEKLSDPFSVAACVKHFAGYGAPVGGRDYNTVELSRHTLEEFYLPSYKAGIDAGAAMVMTSFNTIEGIPATGNKWLMKDILRDHMGFEGVLITDWAAMEEMIYHGYCADRKEAARKALQVGVDIDMMTGIYSENLEALVAEGKVSEELIDESVYRILKLKNDLGLFENPYKDADEELEKEWILCEAHRDLAREAARKSFVLLKNEDLLPVTEPKNLAVIGPYVNNRKTNGSWSFLSDTKHNATLREAISERWKAYVEAGKIIFEDGCTVLNPDTVIEGFADTEFQNITAEECEEMICRAVEAAKKSEKVILALGESYLQSGEATSNANIQIPSIQMELFRRVCAVNENVAVLLFSGRPLDIREIAAKAKTVMMVWMPGTEGARAIVDILSGDYSPSGKLPMSMPYSVGQVPVFYNEYSTGRPHVPGKDKDRFRSKYLDIPNEPLYPYGYGLTYGKAEVSPITLTAAEINREDMLQGKTLKATVKVKNTGDYIITETVQLYLHDIAASVVRPKRELKDYRKINLHQGEEKTVEFKICEKQLQFLSANNIWESEPGEFEVFIGLDSKTNNQAMFLMK